MDEVFWSPAYDVLNKFKVDNHQMDRIFEYWQQRVTDPSNFDPRAAVCQLFGENLGLMQSFVPRTHPRVIHEAISGNESAFVVALVIAVIAGALVCVSTVATYLKRNTNAIYYAQPHS